MYVSQVSVILHVPVHVCVCVCVCVCMCVCVCVYISFLINIFNIDRTVGKPFFSVVTTTFLVYCESQKRSIENAD